MQEGLEIARRGDRLREITDSVFDRSKRGPQVSEIGHARSGRQFLEHSVNHRHDHGWTGAGDSEAETRDYAIGLTFFCLGLRVSELCSLMLEDTDLERGNAWIKAKGRRSRSAEQRDTFQKLRQELQSARDSLKPTQD